MREPQGFSDADIERLREHGRVHLFGGPSIDDLLNRLDAAERMCEYVGKVPDLKNMDWIIEGDRLFQAWRHSACKDREGKDAGFL